MANNADYTGKSLERWRMMKNKDDLGNQVWNLAHELQFAFTYSIRLYFFEVLEAFQDCTDTDIHVHEAKLSAADLVWAYEQLKKIQLLVKSQDNKVLGKLLGSIMSDNRWKRFEVGRVYLTRYDCRPGPVGDRRDGTSNGLMIIERQ